MELWNALGAEPALYVAAAAILGLLVGSFLNVVAYRLPKMMEREWRAQCVELAQLDAERAGLEPPPFPPVETYNLVVPRSACPKCGGRITALQNVPVVSWLALRGRCAHCAAPIPARYPVVEAVTALLSALVAWRFGWSVETAFGLVVTWFLVAMTLIDLDTQLLPDSLTLPLLWLGLLSAAYVGPGEYAFPVDLKSAVLGAAFGYLSLWTIFHAFRLATGKEGMGYGDFKLFAALGAWTGWQMLLPIILFSAATGAVVGLALIAARRLGRDVPIPFGPYLAAAGWLVMMYAPTLVAPWWALGR